MPSVSEFFGIKIYFYYNDHNPPHFHAVYAGEYVEIDINDLIVMNGEINKRALKLVLEWASQHQAELLAAWQEAREEEPLTKIAPLE
jgi:hypothetical protein